MSLAAIVPQLIVSLYRAVVSGDLAETRRLHLLGKLTHPSMRPPIPALAAEEIARLEDVLAIALATDRGRSGP